MVSVGPVVALPGVRGPAAPSDTTRVSRRKAPLPDRRRSPSWSWSSKQKVPLGQRQDRRRLARQQLPVGAHLVGLGVDLYDGQRVVVNEIPLAHRAGVLDRDEAP